jgi:hypothetical protein
MTVRHFYLVVLALVLVSPTWSAAADWEAQYYARNYLHGLEAKAYTLTLIEDSYVTKTFPGFALFSVVFEQYPVGMEPPAGLNPSDIVVVMGDKVFPLTGADDLKAFFLTTLGPVADENAAMEAGKAWLRLAEVFYQDGFFTFSDPVVGVVKGKNWTGGTVIGQIEVIDGGAGRIHAALTFDVDSQLTDVIEFGEVHAGMRPL